MNYLLCALLLFVTNLHATEPELCVRFLTGVEAEPMMEAAPPLEALLKPVRAAVPFEDHDTYARWTFLPFGTAALIELGMMGAGPSRFVEVYHRHILSISDDGLVRWQEEGKSDAKLLKTWTFEMDAAKARGLIAYAYAYATLHPVLSLRTLDFVQAELKDLPLKAVWPVDPGGERFNPGDGLAQ